MPTFPQFFAEPISTADELCELLNSERTADVSQLLAAHRFESGRSFASLVAEIAQRGYLKTLLGGCLPELVSAALQAHALKNVFSQITSAGHYETLRTVLLKSPHFPGQLYDALSEHRPGFDEATLNAAARRFAKTIVAEDYEHDVIIVPGYTPLDATRPVSVRELPAAQQRLELAASQFLAGLAPLILVSGGSVHPAGTPENEALSMREYLLEQGLPAEQILVEPYARHTPTNLRNAGRILRELGLLRGIIITGFESAVFDQAFYLSYQTLSTFADRCRRELGYSVGQLDGIDAHRIAFVPSEDVFRKSTNDPWDV